MLQHSSSPFPTTQNAPRAIRWPDRVVLVALAANSLMDTFTRGQSLLPWRKAFALPTFPVPDTGGKVVYRQIGIDQDA